MKKKITFLVLTCMVLFTGAAFAQDPYPYQTINVYLTDEYIEADGIANESVWSNPNVVETPITNILHNWGEEPVDNTWGYEASFQAVYDDNYLYLFVKVKDATYVPYDATKMTGETNVDNVELFFYPNAEERSPNDETTVTDYRSRGLSQLRVSVGNEDNRATGGGLAMSFASNNVITGYEYKTVQTADGYNVEIVVPWDVVITDATVGNIAVDGKILFDINPANCTDYASNRVIILGWSTNDYQGWKDNKRFGEMVFKGDLPTGIQNPNATKVNYTFNNNVLQLSAVQDNTNVSICDLSGRIMKTIVYNGQGIDLSNLASGVYLVKVAEVGVIKIIK